MNYLSSEFHGVQSSIEGQITAGQQRLRKPESIDEQPGSGQNLRDTWRPQGSRVPTMMRSSLELNCDTRWFLPLRSVIETWRLPLAKRWALLGRIVSIPCLERRLLWVWSMKFPYIGLPYITLKEPVTLLVKHLVRTGWQMAWYTRLKIGVTKRKLGWSRDAYKQV